MQRRDSGQASTLVLATIAVIAAIAAAMLALGVRMAHRDQAQNAADAAALAGATHGRAGAARAAALNNGRVIEYNETASDGGIDVLVVVEVAGEQASARASTEP
jgi:Putative Flp pilus-assembly TadE/G-like